MLDLQDIFGHGGPLARALPDFRVRREQLHMAQRVADALATRESLVVEAGTGTGKTFAYLVPALLSGRRVLISTGTRTLQDQLFAKDLPLVAAALGRPARVALLKGRSQLPVSLSPGAHRGRRRAAQLRGPGRHAHARRARHARPRPALGAHHAARRPGGDPRPVRHASGVAAGHLDARELPEQRCPEFARCHVVHARREALEADIVIVNHHLLLADLALKEDGFGDLLGLGGCHHPR